MPICAGVGGVVKSISSVKAGVGGVVKDVSKAFYGYSGLRCQVLGALEGVQYALCLPGEIYVGESTGTMTEVKQSEMSFLGQSTSGSYNVFKYSAGTHNNATINVWYYQLKTRTYPREYLADYVVYYIISSGSTSAPRGFWCTNSICIIFDNEIFDYIDNVNSEGNYSSYRAGWLQRYKNNGRYPTPFSVTGSVTISGHDNWRYYYPSIYSPDYSGSAYTGTAMSVTGNQSNAAEFNGFHYGALIDSGYSAQITLTARFPSQSITFNGTSYPLYFSFAPWPHS